MDNYNGFPATYQSFQNGYYQPNQQVFYPRNNQYQNNLPVYQQSQNSQPQSNSPMIWVQGKTGAISYIVPNNTTVPLWDSDDQVIYVKTVDQNGKPSMVILDYKERDTEEKEETPKVEYVTKEQFTSLTNQIKDLGGQISDIENRLNGFGKSQSNNSNNNRRNNNK